MGWGGETRKMGEKYVKGRWTMKLLREVDIVYVR